MQITLNHDEILTALDAYVRTCINIADDKKVIIDMKAGRGDNGFSATLDIVPIREEAVTQSATIVKIPAPVSLMNQPEEPAPAEEEQPQPVALKPAGGLFGKKADTVIPDEVAEESTYDGADDTDQVEEAPKSLGKSIFSKAAAG